MQVTHKIIYKTYTTINYIISVKLIRWCFSWSNTIKLHR